MKISDWVLILSSLVLGACALFAPYFAEIFKRFAFSPKIKLKFQLLPPYCHKTQWRSLQQINVINEPVYYFRFIAHNEGKSTAYKCEAVLENLWIYDSSQTPQLYPNFSPVNMKGVGAPGLFVDINPGRRLFCDIGHISSIYYQRSYEREHYIDMPNVNREDSRFMLDLSQYFFSQPNCFGPGRYIIQVGFYSENSGNQKVFFDISWSGKWQEGEEEMFREIVIKIKHDLSI